ncbi:MAG: Eco57I restriction-modification methylase domain-containing protein [Bacteroidetes bacterium]|jgi:adenine-specific DNA-methyltransferase|nr:Eco57I restriction-modification methylase domain-containing protein [Bacteroidota bacterium]
MKLNPLKPRKALNKAFLKVKPNRTDIEAFKANLIQLLDRMDDTESEEFHKNLVSDFLKKTYYDPNHFINTKGRNDLVVHNGDKATTAVGVIIEAKKPANKSEMVKPFAEGDTPRQMLAKLNAKAFQELVLYYLRERITEKNLEIKHLIITNINEWFIFDATTFDRLFAQNKKLIGQFIDFESGRLADTKTDFFYRQIAEPFIAELDTEIEFTYFKLQDYQHPLRNNDKTDDNKLIALFKLLSPEHLLKLPFTNDSNSLDKRFYSELLHIIGLTETKAGSKKLIERNKPGERHSGSLLENAIIQLDSLDKINHLKRSGQYGSTTEEKLFNVGLELCITWINRILFLKLLEAQLITYHRGDSAYAFLNLDKIKDYDDLNSLFFQVLARKQEARNEDVLRAFEQVPYLNSSLFEPTDMEQDTLFISNLRDDKAIPIVSQTVLKDRQGKKRTGQLSTLEYLFEFLNAYDFSSEGSEEIQEENKSLINASVLGLIFEKINGYKDGSFFTPGFITMYMCRETIRKAVLQKFNSLKPEQPDSQPDSLDQYQSIEDIYEAIGQKAFSRKQANDIINSLKICDPAVGSGHFLVSALNEIIAIKNDLKILEDKSGKSLNRYEIEVVNDELIVTDEDGELFEYRPANKESQRIQETLFHEKQNLIENCLFGVDINPNSVKICRLRLWIELLKNAYYKHENELETLPNIDINIKCGNSLVSRFNMDADLKQALKKSKWTIDSYRVAVDTYRNAESKEQKREMERLIADIKSNFRTEITQNDPKAKRLYKLNGELFTLTNQQQLFEMTATEKAAWNKKVAKLTEEAKKLEAEIEAIKANKIFENAFEWRFEFPEVLNDEGDFVGFDVVIGNPPYIYNRDLDKMHRDFFKSKYHQADDLYVYFTYESKGIIRHGGYITLITPNTYFTLSSREKFRDFLLQENYQKYTYSGFCFEDAYVETMIFEIGGSSDTKAKVEFVPNPNDYNVYESFKADSSIYQNNVYKRFFIPTNTNIEIHLSINQKLSEIIEKFSEPLTGKKSKDNVLISYRNNLEESDLTLLGLISEGEQGLVTGNNSRYIAQIVDKTEDSDRINEKFLNELRKNGFSDLKLDELVNNIEYYYEKAEEIKLKKSKPDVFGKFFIYKHKRVDEVKPFSQLPEIEKLEGTKNQTWVNYYKGNSDGITWRIPFTDAILWSKQSVIELSEGKVTNSRWQGHNYFKTTGFAWVDYFTSRIKSFFVNEGIYSKNIVKLHSTIDKLPDKYVVACLNSKFISYYVKNFITSTHTLQINDGRLIPIKVPTKNELNEIIEVVDNILEIKEKEPEAETLELDKKIDSLIYKIYGIGEKEIEKIENN